MNEQIQSLSEENDRLKADWQKALLKVADLVKILKCVEWSGSFATPLCPSCGRRKDLGHREECQLAKALEAT